MQLAQKYTDDIYATKKEIEKRFDTIGIEIIWHEILQYRKQYRMPCLIQNYSIVLTPAISSKIQATQHLMKLTDKTLTQEEYQQELVLISSKFVHFSKLPFFVQLFLIKLIVFQYPRQHVLSLCLKAHGYQKYEQWILDSYDTVTRDIENNDITSAFLDWLMLFRIVLEENVVNLEKKVRKIDKNLKQRYPKLTQNQCDFLFTHHQPHCYYDVSDYRKAVHCSYETARTHLQGLVDERFYRKIKIGKRFVYLVEDV